VIIRFLARVILEALDALNIDLHKRLPDFGRRFGREIKVRHLCQLGITIVLKMVHFAGDDCSQGI
jgi:Fe2+ transport system protein FeoA